MPPGVAGPTAAALPERPRSFPPLRHLLAVAAGGAVGGSMRHALILAFPTDPGLFPWVIFGENIAGAFLLGLLFTVLTVPWRDSPTLRLFLCTGVLGSFTTFSNYSLDIVALVGQGNPGLALAYSLGSIGAGLLACFVGMRLGYVVTGARR